MYIVIRIEKIKKKKSILSVFTVVLTFLFVLINRVFCTDFSALIFQ